ncbi:hypothetical protein BDA99DRAFT_565941 [Phascolomyces articulosus]|uniref:Uncharacterized protein n=1 Tax=Phascolomyces articulosus TaxID=60185 RepID=A0AAD5JXA8_9FUNG|nr:hypothetical protein BDA99DRAFT_565941 [Phascolomyces articulosus]
MADDPSANIRTFDRHCINGTCHCDWRVTLEDCEESIPMFYINIINIIISALGALLVGMKGHTIWSPPGTARGFLRPKPVDFRLVTSVVLVTNVDPGNLLGRSVLYELPWSIGLAGITVYILGVSQAIAQSNSTSGWLPSIVLMDISGIMALILPSLIGIPMTIVAGTIVYKDQYTAELLIRINYGIWFLWTGGIGSAIFFAGIHLVHILKSHHRKFRPGGSNDAAVKAGIFRIQMAASAPAIALWIFALVLLLYGLLRDLIIENTVASVIVGFGWTLGAGIINVIMQIVHVFSPNTINNAALRSKKSTEDGTDTSAGTGFMNSTRPDQEIDMGSTMGAVTDIFQNDDEAITNALKANDPNYSSGYLQQQEFRQKVKKSKLSYFSFGSKKDSKRHICNTSSQVELTSYDGLHPEGFSS